MSNSLAKVHPELISQWSDKNLPLTPDDVDGLVFDAENSSDNLWFADFTDGSVFR